MLDVRAALLAAALLAFLCASPAPALAQQPDSAAADSAAAPIVDAVRFEGQGPFETATLQNRVRTQANRRLLGIPGFTFWRGLYRFGDYLGGRLGSALKRSGEPPAQLSRAALSEDAGRLQALYQQEGFREAVVTPRVEAAGAGHVRVTFDIERGPPMYARRVRYDGLAPLTEAQRLRFLEGSVLRSDALGEAALSDSALTLQAQGWRYSEARLLQERGRMLTFLRNVGYASVTRDSIRALVFPQLSPDPQQPDSFDVVFRVQPGPRYRFGDVRLEVRGPEPEAVTRTDTLHLPGSGPVKGEPAGGLITARIEAESQLDAGLLRRALRVQPGAWYDQSALLLTKRRLENTGVFTFTDITALPANAAGRPDTTRPDTTRLASARPAAFPSRADAPEGAAPEDAAPRLAHRFSLRTRPRHSIRVETFALNRSGRDTPTNEFGTGVGATYENANLLGGGEALRVRLSGSVAADFDEDTAVLPSAQAEASTSLTYPYLVWPFSSLERSFDLYGARTQLSVSLLTARRENLRFILRGRGNARLRFEARHTPTISSLIDLLDVSISNPDTLRGFNEFLVGAIGTDENPIVTDEVQRAQIKEDYTQPQVNAALRYTFRSSNVNPLRREEGYSYEASFEVGNTLPALLDRFVLSPDTVESNLPGLPLLRGRVANRLLYRPYVRFLGDVRRYLPLDGRNTLAGKFILGFAQPTGRPDVVPFDRRFYSGGATSVRGWSLRELRPLADTLSADGSVPNILGGDVKLEASLELRTTFAENALGADWVAALFVDAGNVWFGPRNPGPPEGRFRFDRFYRQIGVGAGVGLRLAWDYLILRLDAAYKVHDPLAPGRGLFTRNLRRPRLHFGIGHAF